MIQIDIWQVNYWWKGEEEREFFFSPACSFFLYKHVLHTRVARSQGGDDRQRESERYFSLSLYVCAKKIGRLLVEWEGSDAISLSLSLLLPANKIDRIQKRCYEKSFPRKSRERERGRESKRGNRRRGKSERRRTHIHLQAPADGPYSL